MWIKDIYVSVCIYFFSFFVCQNAKLKETNEKPLQSSLKSLFLFHNTTNISVNLNTAHIYISLHFLSPPLLSDLLLLMNCQKLILLKYFYFTLIFERYFYWIWNIIFGSFFFCHFQSEIALNSAFHYFCYLLGLLMFSFFGYYWYFSLHLCCQHFDYNMGFPGGQG